MTAMNGSGVLLDVGGKPMAPPMVTICIPSGDDIKVQTMMCVVQLLMHSTSYCRANIMNIQGSSISFQRNQLAGAALEMANADYALFIDSDMIFAPNLLERLLRARRRIVGCTYPRKRPPHDALGRLKPPFASVGGVQPADYVPAGLLLVKCDVFKEIPFPWFFETWDTSLNPPFVSEDYGFCAKARERGIDLFIDLDLSRQVGHLGVQAVAIPPSKPGAREDHAEPLPAHG